MLPCDLPEGEPQVLNPLRAALTKEKDLRLFLRYALILFYGNANSDMERF